MIIQLFYLIYQLICIPPMITLVPYTTLFRSATNAEDRSRVVLHTLSADGSESRAEVIVPAASNTKVRSPSVSGNGERRSEEPRLNSSHLVISYAVFCLK